MKFEAASGAQTQTCVCRNLNQNECTRRRATGVDTQESTRRRATGVGTTCGILFLRSNDRTCCVSVLSSTWTRGAFWCTLRSISARHACAYRDLPRPHPEAADAGPLLSGRVSQVSTMTLDAVIPRVGDVPLESAVQRAMGRHQRIGGPLRFLMIFARPLSARANGSKGMLLRWKMVVCLGWWLSRIWQFLWRRMVRQRFSWTFKICGLSQEGDT